MNDSLNLIPVDIYQKNEVVSIEIYSYFFKTLPSRFVDP